MSEREEPKFFSLTEISNMLGSSQSRTYELLAAHNCPFNAVKIGKHHRVVDWYKRQKPYKVQGRILWRDTQ